MIRFLRLNSPRLRVGPICESRGDSAPSARPSESHSISTRGGAVAGALLALTGCAGWDEPVTHGDLWLRALCGPLVLLVLWVAGEWWRGVR